VGGRFTRLYVHSPDRLARKYACQVLLVEELQRSGIELLFLNRTIGVSPEEDLLLQMQGMIAEYERAKIMERSPQCFAPARLWWFKLPTGTVPATAAAACASRRSTRLAEVVAGESDRGGVAAAGGAKSLPGCRGPG
jgi:Resolvase, N terminal domain